MNSNLARVLAAAALSAAVGFIAARHRWSAKRVDDSFWRDAVTLHVPHARGTITLDGDTDDSGWRGPTGRTGAFVGSDGVTPVHPHSEARFVWGDGFLYLNLYAADEDIRATSVAHDALLPEDDALHLVFTDRNVERIIDVNPVGILTDASRPVSFALANGGLPGASSTPDRAWESRLHVSHEIDGSLNKANDNDEEWALEMAIPLESLGLEGRPGERVGFSARRCDTPHDGKRICGSWGESARHGVLVLD